MFLYPAYLVKPLYLKSSICLQAIMGSLVSNKWCLFLDRILILWHLYLVVKSPNGVNFIYVFIALFIKLFTRNFYPCAGTFIWHLLLLNETLIWIS